MKHLQSFNEMHREFGKLEDCKGNAIEIGTLVYVDPYGPSTLGYSEDGLEVKRDDPFKPHLYKGFQPDKQYKVVFVNEKEKSVTLYNDRNEFQDMPIDKVCVENFGEEVNEAIIVPDELEDVPQFRDVLQLSDYARNNGFDVVGYDEFYNSLSDRDKKTAPEKPSFPPRPGSRPIPFFALFHPERKKPMFVVCDPNFIRIPVFPEILKTVIGHERIHGEQVNRRGEIEYILPDPKDTKSYFSDKNEIMAFAYNLAKELKNSEHSYEDAIDVFKGNKWAGPQYRGLIDDIKKNVDEKTLKRYHKYVYLYLRQMFGKDDDGGDTVEIPNPEVPKITGGKVLEPVEEKRILSPSEFFLKKSNRVIR